MSRAISPLAHDSPRNSSSAGPAQSSQHVAQRRNSILGSHAIRDGTTTPVCVHLRVQAVSGARRADDVGPERGPKPGDELAECTWRDVHDVGEPLAPDGVRGLQREQSEQPPLARAGKLDRSSRLGDRAYTEPRTRTHSMRAGGSSTEALWHGAFARLVPKLLRDRPGRRSDCSIQTPRELDRRTAGPKPDSLLHGGDRPGLSARSLPNVTETSMNREPADVEGRAPSGVRPPRGIHGE